MGQSKVLQTASGHSGWQWESEAGWHMSAARSPSHDDIHSRARPNGVQLRPPSWRDPERIQRVLQVVQERVSFSRGHPEILVRVLHRASAIVLWPTARLLIFTQIGVQLQSLEPGSLSFCVNQFC
jgi:hypothetical protein